MLLYTIQSLEVVRLLKQYSIYYAEFEKASYLQDEGMDAFENAYHWMMAQYNQRKGHDFSSAPVWWYTDIKEAQRTFLRLPLGSVLFAAEIPDKWILLHDADLWYCPLNDASCGWLGHPLNMSNTWTPEVDALFDQLSSLYDLNQDAKEETWKEIFNLSKDRNQTIHAITPFIDLYWVEPKIQQAQDICGHVAEM